MTTTEIQKQVAINLGYWDFTSSAIQTGKDVNSAVILDSINYTYIERIFPEFAKIFPEFFQTSSLANNYESTSSISSITGSTLVSVDEIFTNNVVDSWIYNSTKEESARVNGYTNVTTITLDNTYDWDNGDTIYLLTGVFSFAGDATDILLFPRYVGIKYQLTDTDFYRCTLENSNKSNLFGKGRDISELTTTNSPIYNLSTVSINSIPTSAIVIKPIPEIAVTDGVYVEYIQKPADLSAGTDSPRLPLGFHSLLVDGATSYIADSILNDTAKSNKFERRFLDRFAGLLNVNQSFDEITEDGQLENRIYNFRNRRY